MVTIYNTLSDKKEELAKTKKRLNLFVCGPTVYDFAHLGHARTYLTFDIMVRYLRSRRYRIFYLQNITDVDDKIIKRAAEQKQNPKTLARHFEREYLRDMKALGVKSVDTYARASDNIKEIQSQIKRLVTAGYAYQTKNGVYFEVRRSEDYGKLSGQHLEELRAGWRIEPDPEKKDPLDFALWKLSDKAPFWKSPWGMGRPGWHIEDTAIAEKIFHTLQYDLHGGGVDLKFPHHECEIAQAEAISEKRPFVKLWMHTGQLLVRGEKMSKSLGNFITIREFLKTNPASVLRLMMLLHHYRSPIDYTESLVMQTSHAMKTIEQSLCKLDFISTHTKVSSTENSISIPRYQRNFDRAMEDDFNTPEALAVIFSLVNDTHKRINELSSKEAKAIKGFIEKMLTMLGFELKIMPPPRKVVRLALAREALRNNQQFIPADTLRKKMEELGYKVEDTLLGPFVYKFKSEN